MGDASDMEDINRFLRSEEGKAHLKTIAVRLEGKTITGVDFTNDVSGIGMVFEVGEGEAVEVSLPELDINVLREDFADALEREYYVDYPDREPSL